MSERDLALSYTYSKARYLRAGKSRKAENMRNNEGNPPPYCYAHDETILLGNLQMERCYSENSALEAAAL